MAIAKPVPVDWEAIARANADLQERLFNEGVHLVYDLDGDTLFVDIGEGGPAITKHLLAGMYVRIDPDTFRILGCTVLAFASEFLAKNKLARKAFPDAMTALKAGGGKVDWKGQEATRVLPLFEGALTVA
ncbi:MAG: hypothetical protein HY681_01655 [Chloroflexi bacterium]|nr:hypothetical protein [Chloroflexota bacterium]